MIKLFFILVSLLMLMVGIAFIHYAGTSSQASQQDLERISTVTQIVSPSLSVAYYEPRVLFVEKGSNPAYPQMQPIDKMDFVYAK